VVHARIAGAKLDASNVSQAIDRKRQHEHARHVGAICRQDVWLGKGDHQVGFAELPSRVPVWRGRKIAPVAFGGASIDPSLNQVDFRVA
jgi:hypothetical protein